MLAHILQAKGSSIPPTGANSILHGHPLFYRDPVLHHWGIRSDQAEYFTGKRPHQSTNSTPLVPLLEAFVSSLPTATRTQHFLSDDAEAQALEAIGYQMSKPEPDAREKP